jgi:hypothetical protein
VFYFPSPNKLITSTKAIFPIQKAGNPKTCSIACYTRSNPTADWITDFTDFDVRGMSVLGNGNVMAYGQENGSTVIYTLNGANGDKMGLPEVICENNSETPGDMIGTSDGNFALVSSVIADDCTSISINGNSDIRLVKMNQNFNIIWEQVYSLNLRQEAYHIIQTSDGGFAICGSTVLNSVDQFLLIKTDAEGNLTP